MNTIKPKILLASTINIVKEYCLYDWLDHIKKLTYPVEIFLVDNSPSPEFAKKICLLGFNCVWENPNERESRYFMAASNERTRVKFLAGDYTHYFSCFTGKTFIETNNGTKKIREIKIGDYVKTHQNRYRQVINIFKNKYAQNKPLIWVHTQNSIIKCTPEHPFYVRRNNNYKWVKANDLNIDDKLLYPYKRKYVCKTIRYVESIKKNKRARNIYINEEFARFLGLYLAEGCPTDSGIRLTFNNNEHEYIDFVRYIYKKYFKREATIMTNWATSVALNIRSLNKTFENWFGSKADKKKIPEFVYKWPLRLKLAFIKGYFDGDGTYLDCGGISFGTASIRLASNIQKLLKELGIIDEIKYQLGKPNIAYYKGNEIKSKGSLKGFIKKDATGKIFDLLNGNQKNGFIEIPIYKIENKKMSSNSQDKFVYNLEVEEDNSYIANSVIVHNCECDIFPPLDIIERLLVHDVDVAGTTYWTDHKYDSHLCFSEIYCEHEDAETMTREYRERQLSFEEGQLFMDGQLKPVYGNGMGCKLVSRWVMEKIPFRIDPVKVGFADSFFNEDLWKNGILNYVDTQIIPMHRNSNWNTILADSLHKKLQMAKNRK